MVTTHVRCGKSWSGQRREHCPACCETFNSATAGDMHRVGDWTDAHPRRCLSPEEMLERGMVLGSDGYWRSKADSRPPNSPQTGEQPE